MSMLTTSVWRAGQKALTSAGLALRSPSACQQWDPSLAMHANWHKYQAASHSLEVSSQHRFVSEQRELRADDVPYVQSQQAPTAVPTLHFDDAQRAFSTHSSAALARALAVYSICSIQPFVKNADVIIRRSSAVFGSTLVHAVVKQTFFRHFCAGEDVQEVQPTVLRLRLSGVGGIMNLAKESDKPDSAGGQAVDWREDAAAEARCESDLGTFLDAIRAAATAEGQGFAAIKVTALGQPQLLEQVARCQLAMRRLFRHFHPSPTGIVTRATFDQVYQELFDDGTPEHLQQLFSSIQTRPQGGETAASGEGADWLTWSRHLTLQRFSHLAAHSRNAAGEYCQAALSPRELELLRDMMRRMRALGESAAWLGVRILIDGEHSYFQPAIDFLAVELQRQFNRQAPVVYNTYQCYLKDSHARLEVDVERARQEGWRLGAKLVRGAYMVLELGWAERQGVPSPIHDRLQDTHTNYDRCVEMMLDQVAEGGAEVMVATHNQASIQAAVAGMAARGVGPPPSCGVFFCQLLGMADHLTFTLGLNGYRANKLVTYGHIKDVLPWLIRRAQENSDVLGGVGHETALIRGELWRRAKAPFSQSSASR
eukprot:CAMPEP_0206151982 /NCGR_PEP_ID=MMETSP1473-20131121/39090_1 /ASSEMBLY_ACC=CAM_ASM_001109 /TAXON_ID=1461547 /ORGANISM="Stichococcus sp, Strain RCC1054" /LENGTH=596 /DNA_ID=CAMNT_0053549535 /DNA_START=1925 /DNA_END=3715 /DNA_ORIENTATION=+